MNIGNWIKKWASIQPNRIAIISEEVPFTYREFNIRVNQLANLLRKMGVKKGDRVASLLYNSNVSLEVLFALAKIGAILVPLNFRLAGQEMTFILKDSGAETLIFGEEFPDLIASIKSNIPIKEANHICVAKEPPSWASAYEKGIAGEAAEEPQVDGPIGGEDPHMIMYTSGTTGVPKGAVLSHRKTFFNILNADIYYDLVSGDVTLIDKPLFHSGGLLVQTVPLLYKGGTVILKKRFSPEDVLKTIEKHKVTVINVAVPIYKGILEQCNLEEYDLSSLRCCFTGAERVPPSLLREYQDKGIIIAQNYGQTETSTITWLPLREATRKLGSIGLPVFHGEVRVVDKAGNDVQPGEVGEIIVKGPILMSGYWNRPDVTAETIRDGWLYTEDLAKVDEEGYIYMEGREKDMFISGGENVYPAEVEKLYFENPNISDVAVVGVPDAKWGEAGAVFIVLTEEGKMTEEEALKFLEGKLAKYKIPKSVMFLKELPKSEATKILKYKLREYYLSQKDKSV